MDIRESGHGNHRGPTPLLLLLLLVGAGQLLLAPIRPRELANKTLNAFRRGLICSFRFLCSSFMSSAREGAALEDLDWIRHLGSDF